MKNSSAIAAIVMAVVGMTGILGSTAGLGYFTSSSGTGNTEQSGLMEGHFTIVARHADGTVYAYSQSDNTVTNIGKSCVAGIAFGSNGTNKICTQATTTRFTWLAIGNGTTTPATTDTTMQKEVLRQNATQNTSASGAGCSTCGVGVVNATGTGHGYAVINTVYNVPSTTLTTATTNGPANGTTMTITSGTVISEAGLFDGQAAGRTTGAHMFAHTAVSPTVTINQGDQLTVKYSIAIG